MHRCLLSLRFQHLQSTDVGGSVRVLVSLRLAVVDAFQADTLVAIDASFVIFIRFVYDLGAAFCSSDT
jgi:hypothetical protein